VNENHKALSFGNAPLVNQRFYNFGPFFKVSRHDDRTTNARLKRIGKTVCICVGGLNIKCTRYIKVLGFWSGILLAPFLYGSGSAQHREKFRFALSYLFTPAFPHDLSPEILC
jgi:hypothetical protein